MPSSGSRRSTAGLDGTIALTAIDSGHNLTERFMRERHVPGDIERETASAKSSGQSTPAGALSSKAGVPFVWPAAGAMQVTSLPGGGCNIKITFSERATIRAIGRGQILKVRNIPTKRIAQQYEILIRHEGDFESSYGIVDQTPNFPTGESRHLRTQGTMVEDGDELYIIGNGGFLHFQLSRAGKLVDPRDYIRRAFGGTTDVTHQPRET
jgi:murein DD-endopeptidase MepM/ murein hydrolase activator NlpD